MTINLSNEDAQLFMQNGYTREQVGATVNHYREQGLSDDAIQAKLNARVAGWKTPQAQPQPIPQPTPQPTPQPITQPEQPQETPTVNADGNYSFNLGVEENVYNHDKNKWHDNLRQFGRNAARFFLPKKLENSYIGSKEEEEFLNKYNDSNVPTFEQLGNDFKAGKIDKKQFLELGERRKKLEHYKADAEYRDFRNKEWGKEALLLGTAGLGGFTGLGLKGVAGTIAGTGLGGAAYGLGNSVIDEDINPLKEIPTQAALWGGTAGLAHYGGAGLQKLAQTPLGQKAIQGGKDFIGKTAEKAIGKLSESELGTNIITGAEELGKKLGQGAQNLGEILTKERTLPRIKGQQPPTEQPITLQGLKNNIKSNQFDKKALQTIKGVNRKGRVWTEVLKNEDNAIIQAERNFNDIIKEMSKNPDKLRNPNYVKDIENKIQKIIDDSPYPNEAEFAESFWDRYAKALDDGMKYNEFRYGTTENNIFGGKVEQPTTPLAPETRQSRLTQTMKDAGTLPEELQGITPEYQVLHNADIAEQATQAINENPNKVLGDLQLKATNKDAELSALDFETARQTLQKLYAEGRTDEALALTELISQKASKAGQSVQALSMWSKTTPEGAVRYAQKIISDYNKTAKNKIPLLNEQQANEIMELARNTQMSEIGTRENDIANQLLLKYFKELIPASAGSKLRTLQNISLLLNPKTFLRNIGGNSIYAAMDTGVAKPIAAGIDKIASKFTGQRTRVLPQIKEYTQGLRQGFREGAEDVRLGINTRDKLGSRFNLNDRTSFDNIPGLNQLEKALNYSLQVPDRMFYQAAYNESIANQLRASGLAEPTAEMVKNASNDALEAVFQNNSALGNMVLKMRQGGNELLNLNGYGLGDAFIPYAQTPANVAQQGINYSPLGLIKGINNFRLGNQRQATMDIARALTGTGLMTGGYGLARNGLINPNIDDYETRKNFEALGIRPNTLNLGNYNVSYNQLQPLAAPIAGGAALTDIAKGNAMAGVDRSLQSIVDLGMLQSANKFMADMQDEGLGTATTNLISSIPSRFVPTGLKQITDLTDNTQRDTYDKNPLKQGINQAIAKIPGLNRTLPVKYDVTGQPMQKYQTEGLQRVFDATVNPVFVNRRTNDATVNKLIDLYESTGEKSALLPLADKTVRFKDLQGNQVVRPLNASERNIYQRQLGVINKQLLDNIVNTEFYNNLDDENKINLINTTQRYVKSYVDEELWGKPNAQKRALIRKLTKKDEDKILRKITKIYKDKVLPIKTQQIYNQNFR